VVRRKIPLNPTLIHGGLYERVKFHVNDGDNGARKTAGTPRISADPGGQPIRRRARHTTPCGGSFVQPQNVIACEPWIAVDRLPWDGIRGTQQT
jgi:hypothetical protein